MSRFYKTELIKVQPLIIFVQESNHEIIDHFFLLFDSYDYCGKNWEKIINILKILDNVIDHKANSQFLVINVL